MKNLKSQYRFVKERIPNIDDLDLEDDEVVKELIAKCQVGRRFFIAVIAIKGLDFSRNNMFALFCTYNGIETRLSQSGS